MNAEDLVRTSLRETAEQVAPLTGLYESAVRRGKRRRIARRTAATGAAVLSVAAITTTGVVIADHTGHGGSHRVIGPAGSGGQQVVADPWWDTWPTDRYYNHIDLAFLQAARPTYDPSGGPEKIKVYAAGTTTDGSQWVMYTDPTEGHKIEWLQGRNNKPVEGEVPDNVDAGLTFTTWSFPTQSAEDGTSGNQQWMIVVGRPGTTEIDFSPDGATWQPLDTRNGIAVLFLPNGFPPATARVRLFDANGVYATGTPEGAGADTPSPTPGSTGNPTAEPSSTTVMASPRA
jgi:hypothetical protein